MVKEDNQEINLFLDELPHKLKLETSVCIYKNTIKTVKFLKQQSKSFIAWMCPLLKTMVSGQNEYAYMEGDDIVNIFFL